MNADVQENNMSFGPFILSCNHTSYCDLLVVSLNLLKVSLILLLLFAQIYTAVFEFLVSIFVSFRKDITKSRLAIS